MNLKKCGTHWGGEKISRDGKIKTELLCWCGTARKRKLFLNKVSFSSKKKRGRDCLKQGLKEGVRKEETLKIGKETGDKRQDSAFLFVK